MYTSEANWFGFQGCDHRLGLEVEITGDDTLRAIITDNWRDAGTCPWAGSSPGGCTVTREYTYTLVEPCDDCDFPVHLDDD